MDVTLAAIIFTTVGGVLIKAIEWLLKRGETSFSQEQQRGQTTFAQALDIIEQQHKQIEQTRQETARLVARIEMLEAREDATKQIEAERMAQMRDLQQRVEFLTQRLTASNLERDMYRRQVDDQEKKIAALEQEVAGLRHDIEDKG